MFATFHLLVTTMEYPLYHCTSNCISPGQKFTRRLQDWFNSDQRHKAVVPVTGKFGGSDESSVVIELAFMVCPICIGAALAQTMPAVVAAVSGATAAKLAYQKAVVVRTPPKTSVHTRRQTGQPVVHRRK